MPRYASDNRLNLKVGVNSFSDGKTSLEVSGRVGVNTDSAMQDLDIRGDVHISGSIGIGTTVPGDIVDVTNRSKISVGIVTANEYYGSGLGLTGITSAGSAVNVFGGAAGKLLYQDEPGVTAFFDNGSTGQVLYSRGAGQPPQWLPITPSGAVEGLTVYDEGNLVAIGGTFGAFDFRGNNINVIGVVETNQVGVATITITENMVVDTLTINGVATASTITGADYFGTGDNITGIVTSFAISGAGLTFASTQVLGSQGKGVVTLTAIATTENVNAENLFVSGISTINNVTIVSGGIVDNGTFRNTNMTGVTSIANLDANTIDAGTLVATSATIAGDLTVEGSLSYEDVSDIDSVGVITAREGIEIGNRNIQPGIAATLTKVGGAVFTGIITASSIHTTEILGVGTDIPLNTFQVGIANSAFSVASTASTVSVGIGTTVPKNTLDVRGDTNIEGTLIVNNNSVPSLGMVLALG